MRRNFLLTGLIFLLSGSIFYLTVMRLDPLGEQRLVAFSAFFLSLFCGVASFLTFFFFFASEVFLGRKLARNAFIKAVRRGVLVALFVTVFGVLQLFGLWGFFEAIVLALFLFLVEYIFLTTEKVR